MEHIKHALEERRASLFALRQQEKGRAEWNLFNAVREDRTTGYPVRLPKKAIVLKSPGNVLRIIPLPFPQQQLRGAH